MLRRHFLVLAVFVLASFATAPALHAADTTLAENPEATKPTDNTAHIALILPLSANAFRQPSETVRKGFLAAAKTQPETPAVRIYPTTDEIADVLTVYFQAVQQGARVVVGPLAKNAVSALAASDLVSVPTLSLSMPDQDNLSIPPLLWLFGLSVEDEARQVADLVARDGYRKPLIVAADSPLAKRMQTAFADSWRNRGNLPAGEIRTPASGDLTGLRNLVQKHEADVIFLAGNTREARALRPYIASTLATYATSQAFGGRMQDPRNVDLAGMRFIDMPWLLQPDHPAVMIYPRSEEPMGAEFERLYALGIDALRLATQLYRNPASAANALDGVTGKLSVGREHQIQRELVAAEFQQDSVVVIDSEP